MALEGTIRRQIRLTQRRYAAVGVSKMNMCDLGRFCHQIFPVAPPLPTPSPVVLSSLPATETASYSALEGLYWVTLAYPPRFGLARLLDVSTALYARAGQTSTHLPLNTERHYRAAHGRVRG